MKGNIIFFGGIHGVGKGTICNNISKKYSIPHFSASEVLKWEEISEKSNKKVIDFDLTQERLINGLKKIVKPNHTYLLDGRFTLLDKDGKPKKISSDTFFKIQPIAIVVVTQNVEIILKRLKKRDNNKYDYQTLEKMQELELNHSYTIANEMKIPFIRVSDNDDKQLHLFLNKQL